MRFSKKIRRTNIRFWVTLFTVFLADTAGYCTIDHDLVNKYVTMTDGAGNLTLRLAYNGKCMLDKVRVKGIEVIGATGACSGIKVSTTWSTTRSGITTPGVNITSNTVNVTGINFGTGGINVNETWIFTVSGDNIKWKIDRTYLSGGTLTDNYLPGWDFSNISLWTSANLANGGAAWFRLLESNASYGAHTDGVTLWNNSNNACLRISGNSLTGDYIALRFNHLTGDVLTLAFEVNKNKIIDKYMQSSPANLRNYLSGGTDLWNPYSVIPSSISVEYVLYGLNYSEEYDRGTITYFNENSIRDIMNTIARIGSVDTYVMGGNSWHSRSLCIGEQYIAQLGLGIDDKGYFDAYKTTLDFFRDYALLGNGRMIGRWFDVCLSFDTCYPHGFFESGFGLLLDSNPCFVINVAELYDYTGDYNWVSSHKTACEQVLQYMMNRDSDGDYLVEMNNNYHSDGKASDWIDVIWAAYENAFVNAEMYCALTLWADIEEQLGDNAHAATYRNFASNLKTSFNKTTANGGFWDTTNQWYVYWRDRDNSIHGNNLVIPVNFMAIAYGICDDVTRRNAILSKVETQTAAENLFFWPLNIYTYASGEGHSSVNFPFPKYENGDLFLSWGELGVRAYMDYNPSIAVKYIKKVLDKYEVDGLAYQRYLRVSQAGEGWDILAGNALVVVGLIRDIYGIQPKFDRLYLDPHLTSVLNGTQLKYWLRNQNYVIGLSTGNYSVSVNNFKVKEKNNFGMSSSGNELRYFRGSNKNYSMSIAKSTGDYFEVNITSWATSGNYFRSWTESCDNPVVTASHTVTGLKTNKSYNVYHNSVLYGTYLSDSIGSLVFNYTGSYAVLKAFNIEEAPVMPVKVLCTSSSVQLTADGASTALITASLVNELNETATTATNQVSFGLSGTGSLIGANPASPINGVATIKLYSSTTNGTGTVIATSTGLAQDSVEVLMSNAWVQTSASDFGAGSLVNAEISGEGDSAVIKLSGSNWTSPALSGGGTWNSRSVIQMVNTGSALAEYQLVVTLTPANFNYGSAENGGGDIRFTLSNGQTEITAYWIESWTHNATSEVCVIVPNIPVGTSSIYMYYNNPGSSTTGSTDHRRRIKNHDFETGNTTGWSMLSGTFVTSSGGSTGHQGTYYANNGDDAMTGTARSNNFTLIAGVDRIKLLRCGGANSPSGIEIRRSSDNQVLSSAKTGTDTDTFFTDQCTGLSGYAGTVVYVYTEDSSTSGWGKTFFDDFHQANSGGSPIDEPSALLNVTVLADTVATSGTFTSQSYTPGTVNSWQTLSWTEVVPAGTDVKFQIATSSNGSGYTYVGPDCNTGTYYTLPDQPICPSHGTDSYLRFRIYLSGDGSSSPQVNDISVFYSAGAPLVPSKLNSTASPAQIKGDGSSTSLITTNICNTSDQKVSSATNVITFSVSAKGTLMGTTTKAAVNGSATVIMRSTLDTGTAMVTATSTGLTVGTVNVGLTELPVKLINSASPVSINAGGESTSLITANVCYGDNSLEPTATNEITFTVSGNGILLNTTIKNANGGRATVKLLSGTQAGTVTAISLSAGLTDGSVGVAVTAGSPTRLSCTAYPKSILADGSTSSLVNAYVCDDHDNLVTTVNESVIPGANEFQNSGTGVWLYRKPITVTSSSAQTNYQVKVAFAQVGTSALISAGKMQSDYDDVRFTLSDGATELSYHIDSTAQVFWVKAPTINNGATNLYVYYGNNLAAVVSSGAGTFDFFDDFTGTSVDYSKWNFSGTVSVNGGELTVNPASYVIGKTAFGGNYVFENRSKTTGINTNLCFGSTSPPGVSNFIDMMCYLTNTSTLDTATNNGTATQNASALNVTVYHGYRFERVGTTSVNFYYDDTFLRTHTTNITASNLYHCCRVWGGSAVATYDWVRVRKYAASEPAISVGAEEDTGVSGGVTFSVSGPGTLLGSTVKSIVNGGSSIVLRSTMAPGTAVVTATSDNYSPDSVEIKTGVDQPVKLLLTADPVSILATGLSTSLVTARVCDFGNDPVSTASNTITFSVAGSGTLLGGTIKTAASGNATVMLRSTVSTGTATVAATSQDGGGLESGTVNVITIPAAIKLLITASPVSIWADGVATSLVTSQICDNDNNPVTSALNTITFTVSGVGTLVGTTSKVPSNGIATVEFRSTGSTGTATVTATSVEGDGLDAGTVNVTATPPPVKLINMANPLSIQANSQSTSLITAAVCDMNDGVVTGATNQITFGITGQGTLLGTLQAAAQNGLATIRLLSTSTTGYATVSSTSNGLNGATVNVLLTLIQLDATRTTTTAEPASIVADGTSTTMVKAYLLDTNGTHVLTANNQVAFSKTAGNGTFLTNEVPFVSEGIATVKLKSSTGLGTTTVQAEIVGVAGNGDESEVDVAMVTGSPASVECSHSSGKLLADGLSTALITALLSDSGGHAVTTATNQVTFSIQGGGAILGNPQVSAANGMATVVFRAGLDTSTATVTAAVNGLSPGTVDVCQIACRVVLNSSDRITYYASPPGTDPLLQICSMVDVTIKEKDTGQIFPVKKMLRMEVSGANTDTFVKEQKCSDENGNCLFEQVTFEEPGTYRIEVKGDGLTGSCTTQFRLIMDSKWSWGTYNINRDKIFLRVNALALHDNALIDIKKYGESMALKSGFEDMIKKALEAARSMGYRTDIVESSFADFVPMDMNGTEMETLGFDKGVLIGLPYADSDPKDGIVDGTDISVWDLRIFTLNNGYWELCSTVNNSDIRQEYGDVVLSEISHLSAYCLMAVEREKIVTNLSNYPNPTFGSTTFLFDITDYTGDITIRVYTLSGRLVSSLPVENMGIGHYEEEWEAKDSLGNEFANGIYFYRVSAVYGTSEVAETGKLVIIR